MRSLFNDYSCWTLTATQECIIPEFRRPSETLNSVVVNLEFLNCLFMMNECNAFISMNKLLNLLLKTIN